MKNLHKLSFLCLLTGLLCGTSCGDDKSDTKGLGKPEAKKTYIRKNADSPEAQRDLVALDSAIKVMKTLPCDNPLSWYYQGAIHSVPDSVSASYPFCPSYQETYKLLTAWKNCTHGPNEVPIHFLTWHRLYVYHLEKIVRKLSGYPDFALPYWNYANALDGTPGNRAMPAALRDSSHTIFEASRFTDINQGKPIEGNSARALSLTALFRNTIYASFSHEFEIGLHGTIHDYVGMGNDTIYPIYNPIYGYQTQGGMLAWVASAGFDPVFWLHHSEVDHIWQMWTNKTNVHVTLAELQQATWPYVFFDENGKQVTYTVDSSFVQMVYNLDYKYDDLLQAPAVAIQPMLALQAVPHDTVAKVKVGKKITGKLLTQTAPHNLTQGFVLKSPAATEGKQVLVSLELSYMAQPRGAYEVYLNLPKNAKPDPESPSFLGFINFFDATHHAAGHSGHDAGGKKSMTFQLDITDEMAALKALDKSQLDITIYRADGQIAKGLTLESLTLISK